MQTATIQNGINERFILFNPLTKCFIGKAGEEVADHRDAVPFPDQAFATTVSQVMFYGKPIPLPCWVNTLGVPHLYAN